MALPPTVLTQEPSEASLRLAGQSSPRQTLERGALDSVSSENGLSQKAGERLTQIQTDMGTGRPLCLGLLPCF